ncbi:MAG: SCO family protein [Anaerolineae bacterium]
MLGGAVIVALALLTVALVALVMNREDVQPENAAGLDGVTVLNPPRELTDFTLTSDSGEPLSLSDLEGQYVLTYFGYTRCPDACPMTLLDFKRVKSALGAEAEGVTFLFVSVDGERDTPELIDRYLERYDPAFIGMSGTDDVLLGIRDEYGLFYERRETENGYLVDHTASSFLIDPQGRLVRVYSFTADPAVIAQDLAEQL